MNKVDLRSMNLEQMLQFIEQLGEKNFRGKQVYQWVHEKLATNIAEMTNLSKGFRETLESNACLSDMVIEDKQISKKDGTIKFLFSLSDGNVIESVWMQYKHGNSVCISSQVGCKMGCSFCASTLDGFARNLTTGEMLSQIYMIQRETGERVSNVIVMGIGEPLDNLDNLLSFIRILSDENGLNISQRNITVSTCGLLDKVKDLMKEHLQITLAISLHAPNDTIRKQTMPIANRYSMDEMMEVCKEYIKITGRRITFEYCMVQGVNDKKEDAIQLSQRLKGMNCHVNLIPLNEVKERKCLRSREKDIHDFKIMLEKNRINVTIRREMGSDIDAACGQLRKKYIDQKGR